MVTTYFVKEPITIPKVTHQVMEVMQPNGLIRCKQVPVIHLEGQVITTRLIYQGGNRSIAEALATAQGRRILAAYEQQGKSVEYEGHEYNDGKLVSNELRSVSVVHAVKTFSEDSGPESFFKPLPLTPEEKKYLTSLKAQK